MKKKLKKSKGGGGFADVNYNVTIFSLQMDVSGEKCSILGRHAGCLIVSHKKPRSSTMVTRAIPNRELLYASGNEGIGGGEVTFRTPVKTADFTGKLVESLDNGNILVFVDEDGERTEVRVNDPTQMVEITAEGESSGKRGKKKKKDKDSGDKSEKKGKKKKKKKKKSDDFDE